MIAVVFFIVAHALAKAAMFLAAGNIQNYFGHDEIDRVQGVARLQPVAVFTFAIAGVSLIGLPPSGGFIAKWLLLNTAIQSGQWWWVVIMLLGGLLAALYVGRVVAVAFSQMPSVQMNTGAARPVSRSQSWSGLVLALAAVLLGFNTDWLMGLLGPEAAVSATVAGGWQ